MPEILSKKNISICPGWEDETGNIILLSDMNGDIKCNITVKAVNCNKVEFDVLYSGSSIKGCKGIIESYRLSMDGLSITSGILNPCTNKIYFFVPMLLTNGRDITNITTDNNIIIVALSKFKYIVKSNGIFAIDNGRYGNRNGEYGLAIFNRESHQITISLSLYK